MTTALVTFIFKGVPEKTVDLDLSLSMSVGQCLESLKQANWLPEDWEFNCEFSDTGEKWNKLDHHVILAEVIRGDGAIVRIMPF